MADKLYGKNIDPDCSYCKIGTYSEDRSVIFCKYKGVIEERYSCRRFQYDPIKRVPKLPRPIDKFSPEDFDINS